MLSSSNLSQPPERILIRGTNWIGDTVMSLAALREIRRIFPGAHLSILAKDWAAGVLSGQELVDEIIAFDRNRSSLRQLRRARKYDLAILFQNAFEAALLTFLARIPERAGYDLQLRGLLLTRRAQPRIKLLNRHQIYYYLDLLYQTGISSVNYLETKEFSPDISLKPTGEGLEKARILINDARIAPDSPIVGLNPGAYFGPAKRWFTDRYAALADRLIEDSGSEVIILGSPGEQKIAEEIQGFMNRRPHILTGKTDLETLVALISLCRLFVTNDSGPMHLGAALEVPLLAIFGSTDEIATGPCSTRAKVIHKHVECSPCLRRDCPIDLRCFSRISVDEVYKTAAELMELEQ
jgi:heptosyltransferase-2